jgi:Tfp pilus assembly protein PilF
LRLAVLFWQVYKDDMARNYLKRALEIDPNYLPSREFERVMGG